MMEVAACVAHRVVNDCDVIPLKPMDASSAVKLFRKKLSDEAPQEDIRSLVELLGFIPISIVQAASYIQKLGPLCPVSEYIRMLERRKDNLMLLGKLDHLHAITDQSNDPPHSSNSEYKTSRQVTIVGRRLNATSLVACILIFIGSCVISFSYNVLVASDNGHYALQREKAPSSTSRFHDELREEDRSLCMHHNYCDAHLLRSCYFRMKMRFVSNDMLASMDAYGGLASVTSIHPVTGNECQKLITNQTLTCVEENGYTLVTAIAGVEHWVRVKTVNELGTKEILCLLKNWNSSAFFQQESRMRNAPNALDSSSAEPKTSRLFGLFTLLWAR